MSFGVGFVSSRSSSVGGFAPADGGLLAGSRGRGARPGLSSGHITAEADFEALVGCSAEYCDGGRSIRVRIPAGKQVDRVAHARGVIRGFSQDARHRMLHLVNSIDQSALEAGRVLFCTLTYPARFPSARETKRHLETFRRRLWRAFGRVPFIWKLEPQKRGAPHYHVLLFWPVAFAITILRTWFSQNWFEVVESGDEKHLRAGTQVDVAGSWNQVAAYAAKSSTRSGQYMGKVFGLADLPDEVRSKWHNPGRFWGVYGKELLPIHRVHVDLSRRVAAILRRACVRYYEHQATGLVRFVSCEPSMHLLDGNGRRVPYLVLPARAFREPQSWEDVGFQSQMSFGKAVPIRRRWRSSAGGVSCFMSSADFERLLAWAKQEAGG